MGDRDERGSSGSTTAIAAIVVLLLLGLPCLAVVALVGARFLVFHSMPTIEPAPIVQPMELPIESKPPVVIEKLPPVTNTPAPVEGK